MFRFVNTQKQFHLKWKPSYFHVSWFKQKCIDKIVSNRGVAWKIHWVYPYMHMHIRNCDFISKDHGKCYLIVISQQSKRQGLSNMRYKVLSPEVWGVFPKWKPMCLPIILLKHLSAGLKQALILHLGASVPYLLQMWPAFTVARLASLWVL